MLRRWGRFESTALAMVLLLALVVAVGCSASQPAATAPTAQPKAAPPATQAPAAAAQPQAPAPTAQPQAAAPKPQAQPTAAPQAPAREFKIGMVLAVTGEGAWYGKVMGAGPNMAIDEVNASGALPFKLVPSVVDHKSGDANAGVAGMRKLVDIDKVQAVLSSWPNITLAITPIAQEKKIPVFNGGGVAPELIGIPWLHNTRVMEDQQAVALITYMRDELGIKRIAQTGWTDPGGTQTRAFVQKQAANLGITVVASEGHEAYLKDYRAILARIKAARPDGLAIWSHAQDIGYIVKQAKEMSINIPMGAALGLDPEAVKVAGAETLEGLYLSSEYFDPQSKLPWAQQFIKNYKTKTGDDPEYYAANYYEHVYILRDAIKAVLAKGGDPFNGDQLEQAVIQTRTYPSLFGEGKMELLKNGAIVKPLAVQIYKSGKEQLIKTVMPTAPAE